MLRQTLLAAFLAGLMLVVPARATNDLDGTPWTMYFDGAGHPAAQGWSTWNYSSSTYNDDYKIGTGNLVGWHTSNGNPGGSWGKSHYYGLTKTAGWTVAWSFVTYNSQTVSTVYEIDDDTNMLRIDYAPNQVTLRDGMPPAGGGGSTSSLAVDMSGYSQHTFRLVRQAGSPTVKLYVDNNWSTYAQITPAPISLPWADEGNLNNVYAQNSLYETSLDWFGLHSVATIPEPVTLSVLALGGLVGLIRRQR